MIDSSTIVKLHKNQNNTSTVIDALERLTETHATIDYDCKPKMPVTVYGINGFFFRSSKGYIEYLLECLNTLDLPYGYVDIQEVLSIQGTGNYNPMFSVNHV